MKILAFYVDVLFCQEVTKYRDMPLFVKVFSENWVVYHYFNLRAHRYEMSVVEIYDQSRAVHFATKFNLSVCSLYPLFFLFVTLDYQLKYL